MIWKDEEGVWKHDPVAYSRSGAAALTELAPGAHFYAHGRELVVDAVDIGIDGAALRPTAFCPRCGLAHQFEPGQPPQACPSCQGAEIADAGQHRDVIDLTRVYSTMSRSRTRIGDSRDEREKVQFERALSVSFHEARTVRSWSAAGTGFGMRLDRDTILTRLNLGKPQSGTETIRISGEDRTAPGFLLCARCGHHDSDTAGNSHRDHQAWCELRYARDADNRPALLSRTLQTETVLITLPPDLLDAAAGDLLPNLVAALQLGIETRFGGSIGNLDVDVIAHPTQTGHRAVLLSDTIVGGTGYLYELAAATSAWNVLVAGLTALQDCPCQDEGTAACHRCLLPYAKPGEHDVLRRTSAIEALQILLTVEEATPDAVEWTVEEREAELGTATESPLERRFRNAYIEAMRSIDGADVTTRGTSISVRHDGQTFTLEPQVDVAGSRPDFLLTWPGKDVEGIAIFTDGHTFHATAARNRVADDAIKRMRLRRNGYMVLSVTEADLDEAAQRVIAPEGARSSGELPLFVDPGRLRDWVGLGVMNRELEPMLRATPLEMLVRIVRRGKTDRLRRIGGELSHLLVPQEAASALTTPGSTPPEMIASDLLDGRRPDSFTDLMSLSVVRGRDELALVGRVSPTPCILTLVLDDRDEALRRESSNDAWRAWLHLANLAQGEPGGDSLRMTTKSLVEAGIDVGSDEARAPRVPSTAPVPAAAGLRAEESPSAEDLRAPSAEESEPTTLQADYAAVPAPAEQEPLTPAWQAAMDDADGEAEQQLIGVLSQYDIEPPVIGDEYATGIPLEIAWPERKIGVTTSELEARERAALEQEGWEIVGPDPETVLAALELTDGGDS